MSGLSAVDLARMRAHANELLPDTCTIQSKQGTLDSTGSPIVTWQDAATGVACFLYPASPSRRMSLEAAQVKSRSVWVLILPYDQSLVVGNRIVFGGEYYRVVGVEDDHSSKATMRVIVTRVEEP